MAKKKYYAVKAGRVAGIYETWAECKEQIDGFSGAAYKGFTTKEEAEQFIGVISSSSSLPINQSENSSADINTYISAIDDTTLVAFVDGSYDHQSMVYGYGVVLVGKDGTTEEIIGSDNNKDYVDSRNVAGEIEGVQSAITHAVGKGYKKIAIFYDYTGIEKWAVGEWQAKTAIAKDYVVFVTDMRRCIDIEFHKVKAHSGIEYNEKADELAKKSLLKKGIKNNSDGCVTVTGIDKGEFVSIFELLELSNAEIRIQEAGKAKKCTNFILSLNNDKIVVSCYNNGTTTIQGKQSKLLEELMMLVVELLPNKGEVVELLNDYYEVNIEESEIFTKFNHLLPNFDKNKTNDQKLINTLNQAVYNTMLKGKRPDYTDLATPSLRVIEYYMYKILVSKGIVRLDDNVHGFKCFDKIDDVYYLQQAHQIHYTAEQVSHINDLYNFYQNHRNTLNHWDKNGVTRVLKTMEEARILIFDNLELIDKYYTVF
ncbi:viroplasmin family protein [Neobacillus sp. PS2-9]|uniref:ribonuclease H1 domain-containing protein n=1 Tax=Neobacillus sp. PS2-9 TaxID=3070676 RepID=UPI0027E1539F|nr:viroplasmin family protein [Neobacillus sp. PS2-9]WML58107.1 viroplasmin family protein [Neobacillus sp. PS2-9]